MTEMYSLSAPATPHQRGSEQDHSCNTVHTHLKADPAYISGKVQQPWLQETIDSLSLSKEWKIFIRSPFTTWSQTASQQSDFMLEPRHGM